jgi:uncharacterized SAM-binding protein YcdF (DUF218 family)
MTYIQPLLFIVLLALVFELYRCLRRPQQGGKPVLIAGATLVLFLASWMPFARALQRPIEDHFLRMSPHGNARALVVISGAMVPPDPVTHQERVGSDTYARCLYTAWLYNHWRSLPVLTSGGPARSRPNGVSDAAVMKEVLINAGVPAADIRCESRSHSTHENAVYSALMLHRKGIHRIVLVTSAVQMIRAELCFRKEGLVVVPAACDYQTFTRYRLRDYFPCWRALRMNEDLLHELVGTAYYWLRGWV